MELQKLRKILYFSLGAKKSSTIKRATIRTEAGLKGNKTQNKGRNK